MKRKKSFLKRHIIAISFLILVGVYSMYSLHVKEQRLNELEMTSEQRIEEIRVLKHEILRLKGDLEEVNTSAFYERTAREIFKMVYPHEIYFQMISEDEEDE